MEGSGTRNIRTTRDITSVYVGVDCRSRDHETSLSPSERACTCSPPFGLPWQVYHPKKTNPVERISPTVRARFACPVYQSGNTGEDHQVDTAPEGLEPVVDASKKSMNPADTRPSSSGCALSHRVCNSRLDPASLAPTSQDVIGGQMKRAELSPHECGYAKVFRVHLRTTSKPLIQPTPEAIPNQRSFLD